MEHSPEEADKTDALVAVAAVRRLWLLLWPLLLWLLLLMVQGLITVFRRVLCLVSLAHAALMVKAGRLWTICILINTPKYNCRRMSRNYSLRLRRLRRQSFK